VFVLGYGLGESGVTPNFHLATEFGENCHAILPSSPTELPTIRNIWRNRQLKKH
jgi:hypothetical protein